MLAALKITKGIDKILTNRKSSLVDLNTVF